MMSNQSAIEPPRSVRRSTLMGDRREVLASLNEHTFTIKHARNFLRDYDYHRDDHEAHERQFFTTESFLIHYIWKNFFPTYRYMEIVHNPPDIYNHMIEYTEKWMTDRLLAARRGSGSLTKFVKLVREALIAKGLILPYKRLKREHDKKPDHHYRITEDGIMLSSAAWFPPLTREKADALIQGVIDRAVYIQKHPAEFLCSVKLLGVFGSYTDDRVTAYNDVDMVYEITRDSPDESEGQFNHWREQAERLFNRDGRTPQGLIGETDAWPATKARQYLQSRKRQIRLIGMVSKPIRLKIVYLHPYGVLENPIWLDLPNGMSGMYMWKTIAPPAE